MRAGVRTPLGLGKDILDGPAARVGFARVSFYMDELIAGDSHEQLFSEWLQETRKSESALRVVTDYRYSDLPQEGGRHSRRLSEGRALPLTRPGMLRTPLGTPRLAGAVNKTTSPEPHTAPFSDPDVLDDPGEASSSSSPMQIA